ncbi:MAG: sugar phosphate isomerase/epimerase [Chitinophagaceae bacterium]
MNRNFLLGLLLVTANAFSQNSNMNDWRLAIQTWTFHKYSFMESIDKADSLGVRQLEVYPGQKIGGEMPGVFSYSLDKDARDKLKQYLQYKKIKVAALGVIDKEYYNKNNLEKFFEFAKYMGIPFITAEPEWNDLDEFNRLAAKYKVKVALHCHPKPSSHYWHPDSTVKAMKGRKNIGAWPDIGHWARNGVNILDAMKKVKGKIWGLHLKDVAAFGNLQTEDVLFGKGICDIPAVLIELNRQRFKGVIVMEYEVNENNNMGDMKMNKVFYDTIVKKLFYSN